MNKVILMGRLTRDPEIRYSGGDNSMAIARYSIAVDRRFKRQGDQADADFFNCTAFGRTGEFVERYLRKGTKIVLDGELQNDNYTNKEGKMVYGMRIIANNIEFAESKNASGGNGGFTPADGGFAPQDGGFAPADAAGPVPSADIGDGFMDIDDGVEDDGIPFA